MRKLVFLVAICSLCMICTACSDKDTKEARATLNTYYAAFTAGDVDQMAALTSNATTSLF